MRHVRLGEKARHEELGLARLACRARERLADFFSILIRAGLPHDALVQGDRSWLAG